MATILGQFLGSVLAMWLLITLTDWLVFRRMPIGLVRFGAAGLVSYAIGMVLISLSPRGAERSDLVTYAFGAVAVTAFRCFRHRKELKGK